MKSLYALSFLTLFSSAAASKSSAQSKPLNAITTAVPFLRVSADARSAGMGDLGVATTPDANALFYNMGKVAFNTNASGVGISYTPWLKGLDRKNSYLLSFAGYHKLDDMQAISGGVRYLSQGDFNLSDDQGNSLGTSKPSDLAIEAGYSRKLSPKTGFGLSLRYIHSKLADNSGDNQAGNTVAADLGFYYAGKSGAGKGWNFGAALTNLGGKIGYVNSSTSKDFIPANLSLGTNYSKMFNAQNKISFGLELNKLLVPTPPSSTDVSAMADYRSKGVVGSWFSSFGDAPGGFGEEIREFQMGLGAEYMYNDEFELRAGYSGENDTKGNRKYLTFGTGLHYKMGSLNFSYLVPTGSEASTSPLKNTFRLSLLFDFQKGQATAQK